MTSRTAPGAEKIANDLESTLDFWSSQVPPQEMKGFIAHDSDSVAATEACMLSRRILEGHATDAANTDIVWWTVPDRLNMNG